MILKISEKKRRKLNKIIRKNPFLYAHMLEGSVESKAEAMGLTKKAFTEGLDNALRSLR